MPPSDSTPYFFNGGNINTKLIGNGGSLFSTFKEEFYIVNLIFSKLRHSVIGTFRMVASFLLKHVTHIFKVVPKEKMIWVNTRRVVTFMQNAYAMNSQFFGYWYFSVMKYPRDSVSGNRLWLIKHFTVSTFIFRAFPNPAPRCFINFLPKVNFELFGKWLDCLSGRWEFCSKRFSHNNSMVELLGSLDSLRFPLSRFYFIEITEGSK